MSQLVVWKSLTSMVVRFGLTFARSCPRNFAEGCDLRSSRCFFCLPRVFTRSLLSRLGMLRLECLGPLQLLLSCCCDGSDNCAVSATG